MSKDNLLLVASSDQDADMLYAVRMFVPDPFVYLRLRGKCHVVMNDLEIDRARQQARHCKVLSLTHYQEELKKDGVKQPTLARVIRAVLKENRLKKVSVPYQFPYGLAKELRDLNVKLKVRPGGCFPRRALKTPEEVKKISAALMMAEVGLAEGIQALKRCKVAKNGRLMQNNLPLTSERLRAIIDTAILQAGGVANHTIVAGGAQACDPHEEGRGPLRANQPIVLDVFPRSQKTGYWGDITRTVVKGRASEPVRKLYYTVGRAQEIAFSKIANGVEARLVHQAISEFFEAEGYKTTKAGGRWQGFFHGTGHGVGLEIHEAPRIGKSTTDKLAAGHVVTVEPGLYYPEIGGVRLEDIASVTRAAPKNLTKFEKTLEV
jgi:Xaa-Pro aminopeptidase